MANPEPQSGLGDLDYFRTFTELTRRTVAYLQRRRPYREGYRQRLRAHADWIAAELERTKENQPCQRQSKKTSS